MRTLHLHKIVALDSPHSLLGSHNFAVLIFKQYEIMAKELDVDVIYRGDGRNPDEIFETGLFSKSHRLVDDTEILDESIYNRVLGQSSITGYSPLVGYGASWKSAYRGAYRQREGHIYAVLRPENAVYVPEWVESIKEDPRFSKRHDFLKVYGFGKYEDEIVTNVGIKGDEIPWAIAFDEFGLKGTCLVRNPSFRHTQVKDSKANRFRQLNATFFDSLKKSNLKAMKQIGKMLIKLK